MQDRIQFKLLATGLNLLISIVIGVLVPRFIGPASYGDYSYIVSTYAFLLQFLMLASGVAYVYFLSHDKYKLEDINMFYMIFLGVVSFFVLFIAVITINSNFGIKYLWNGVENKYHLYLGLIFGLLINFQQRKAHHSRMDIPLKVVQSKIDFQKHHIF